MILLNILTENNMEVFIIFKGFKYYISTCWKFNKTYVILLVIKQIISSLFIIISLISPKYIINSLFVDHNVVISIKFILGLLTITLSVNILNSILEQHIFLKRMLVFKEFQLYLGNIVMDTDYCNTENPVYLDTREKAYKYLYGNNQGFGMILENGFQIIGNLINMVTIGGVISQLSFNMIFILIAVAILNVTYDAVVKKRIIKLNMNKVKYERRSLYFSNIFSDFRYGKEIRINSLKKWLSDKYDAQLIEMQNIYRLIGINNLKGNIVGSVLYFVQQAILYVYVIYKVLLGSILVGDFSMYLNGIAQFSRTFKSIMSQIIDLRQCTDYFMEYEKYIDMNNSKTSNGKIKLETNLSQWIIEYHNVSYKYYGQNDYALRNVSIKFSSNQKIAIVGENGSGKTTFIKLLLRIYNPTEGYITLNDIDIAEIDYDNYRELFSAVFQDYKLFSMSIRDNIELSHPQKPFNYDEFLGRCGLAEKIEVLPKGINTYIYKDFEKDGFEPSGGEGQKIAFLRALYRETPFVILDEATAALDPKAEANIYVRFNTFFKDKAIIYISHRMSVTRFCDRIYLFKNGKIVEDGTHESLIHLNGEYTELYNSQAQYYK